jgi:hypothetical protein
MDKFQHSTGAVSNLIESKKISSGQQDSFIKKSSWAAMSGGEPENAAVAQASATILGQSSKVTASGGCRSPPPGGNTKPR